MRQKEGEQPRKADSGKSTGIALVKLNEIGMTKDDIEKELQGMPEAVREAFLQDSSQFMRFLGHGKQGPCTRGHKKA